MIFRGWFRITSKSQLPATTTTQLFSQQTKFQIFTNHRYKICTLSKERVLSETKNL